MPSPRRRGRRALRVGTRFSGSSLDTLCSLLKFRVWMRKKSSSSPFGGMLKSSFRQISSYLVAMQLAAKIKPAASQNAGRRRPSLCENSSSSASSGYSAHTKPSELPQTAVSGRQARDLRHKTNAPAPRRGFSHRPRNDIRAALALVAVSHADAPADRDCRAKI